MLCSKTWGLHFFQLLFQKIHVVINWSCQKALRVKFVMLYTIKHRIQEVFILDQVHVLSSRLLLKWTCTTKDYNTEINTQSCEFKP
jgi:hypothetical protein